MSRLQIIWTLGVLALALNGAWAQDNPTQQPPEETQPSAPQGPVPAYGQENAPPPISENPPLSGLDLPSLEPHAAPVSYLQPGATFSESADTNAANNLGGSSVTSVTRALGSVTLKRLWSHYDLGLDYVGGAGYYNVSRIGFQSLQQMDLDQKITWKRGQLSLRDSFSYLPEGNFGGSYGSLGSEGIASLGSTAFSTFWGGTNLGSLGIESRIMNVSLADISENLTPKSAVTAAGGYAFTHFLGNDPETSGSFIGSSQVSAQAGYDRLLSAHTQVALVYGYQGFDFSIFGTAFHSHVVEGMYGHRITGRLDLLLAAGPQVTLIDTQSAVCSNPALTGFLCTLFGGTLSPITIRNTSLSVAANGRLRYKFPKTFLELWFQRFETGGSGLFAGAQSNVARLTVNRPLSRVWSTFADLGFAQNNRVQQLTFEQLSSCAAHQGTAGNLCPANDASSFTTGFIGGGFHRSFGRSFHAYISYQFNELYFNKSYCLSNTSCNRISNRSVGTFGLDWTPRPIRLD